MKSNRKRIGFNYSITKYPALLTEFNQFDGFYTLIDARYPTQNVTSELLNNSDIIIMNVQTRSLNYIQELLIQHYFGDELLGLENICCANSKQGVEQFINLVSRQTQTYLNVLLVPEYLSSLAKTYSLDNGLSNPLIFKEIPFEFDWNRVN